MPNTPFEYPDVLHSPVIKGSSPATRGLHEALASPQQTQSLADAYRQHGYRIARLDPLGLSPAPRLRELAPAFHDLDIDQARGFDPDLLPGALTVRELAHWLHRTYCGNIGFDCTGLRDEIRRKWLYARIESESQADPVAPNSRETLLHRLLAAEAWERLAAQTVPDGKRFSLEGCESLLPLMDAMVDNAGRNGVRHLFVSMPHRGRLNILVNLFGVPAQHMLECLDPLSDTAATQTDLPYHLGAQTTRATTSGHVDMTLASNPSHLESAFPVVSGMARAWRDDHPESDGALIVVHGDAAFAGQGVVPETLNMTRQAGYSVGGTIHVIVNNQIGFTTPNRMNAESPLFCTDVTRMIDAPVIHVNADYPDDVLRAVRIAFDYRMHFGTDVVIDLIGYRRLGHSEHDLPAVTQPQWQKQIDGHIPVCERYHAMIPGVAALESLRTEALNRLGEVAVENTRIKRTDSASNRLPLRTGATQGCPEVQLHATIAALTTLPPGLRVHEKVRRLIDNGKAAATQETSPVNWTLAENLAYATLLDDGVGLRISGMDVGRGTFMHRHAVWHAQGDLPEDESTYVPLQHIGAQGQCDIVNSPLTEEAVLGFEYGYSVQTRSRLTIWEAQYGDFANGAQVMIDQFIASGEYKWGQQSALTVLLPHGHEGVGPEHSNGYLGRFLQLCAANNLCVTVPSTSAQWFHLLREQAASNAIRPLIVMSPKSRLYEDPASHGCVRDLVEGRFLPVIAPEDRGASESVTRVVLCSGKFYYELEASRAAENDGTVALVRIEQLYPFPSTELGAAFAAYPNLRDVVWTQEEDANQGAWRSVREEIEAALPSRCALKAVCRTATPSGAHASQRAHRTEQARLVRDALGY
ncbi:2-oxoglutarate dehydrogenase E1 component [Robbsia andropogonis]|uniref:2-oxoglutarate dehydrogenase E1 component n=1 Tax=Robbsia andropogonis TaxID=28092 RepID=UPI0009E227A1|nr:2-oxoglutarate dehydrogenase E1 component [Robbsia andropogonis]